MKGIFIMKQKEEERVKSAASTLETINECIKSKETSRVSQIIGNCPHFHELAHVLDKDGQGILFKVGCIEDEEKAMVLVEQLEREGSQLFRKDNNRQTMLYYVARYGRIKLAKYLIEQGIPLNQGDYINQTPIFYSARYNKDTAITKLLIQHGAEVNQKDANGQTSIFYAAAEGNLEMCRLLADNQANLLATDKNKQRPMHYAKRGNHRHIIEFLANFNRNDSRKIREPKEDRRVQESSQNTVDRRRKKEGARNEYSLVFTNQNGETKVLSYEEMMTFQHSSEEHSRLFTNMCNPFETFQGLPLPPDRRFQKLAMKIVGHFTRHENGHFFNEPVNYQVHGLYDYPTIVKFPMDFATIRRKLVLNAYDSEIQFQGDMNLVFDNCILYHGTDRDLGKIALQIKTQFNAMFFKEFA